MIIQKNYIKYKSNKKLKNIYCRLPDDIQNRIKFFINQQLYYNKYKLTINKIINKKVIKYFFYKKYDIEFTIDEIKYHYYLIHKYYSVININILKFFYTIAFDINILLTVIIEENLMNYLNIINYNSFINHIKLIDLDNDKLLKCLKILNKFQNLYENKIINTIIYY